MNRHSQLSYHSIQNIVVEDYLKAILNTEETVPQQSYS